MSEDRSRQRLGRGLASLMGGGGEGAARPVPGFERAAPAPDRMVAIDRVTRNPHNPRRRFDEAELAELSASIAKHGIVQPILVRPAKGDSARFEIVAGERRWRAAQLAGLSQVPVVIRDLGDRETMEIAIIENVQRADLNIMEEARGYQALIEEHGYTQAELAEVIGKSRSHVANTMRLLKLPGEVAEMVTDGALSAGHARTVVSADDPLAFARTIVSENLSVREAEERARKPAEPVTVSSHTRTPRPQPSAKGPPQESDTARLERLLSEALGMNVSIRLSGGRGGDIRIDYESLEELDEICRVLQVASVSMRRGPRVRSL